MRGSRPASLRDIQESIMADQKTPNQNEKPQQQQGQQNPNQQPGQQQEKPQQQNQQDPNKQQNRQPGQEPKR
jgi:hypothetical protein